MIQFPAYISGVKTMADGSLRIQLDTQELKPETMTQVFRLKKSLGVVHFVSDERDLTEDEQKFIDKVVKELASNTGSKSKELRNMIYGLWKESNSKLSFEEFYVSIMDMLIVFVKEKKDQYHNGA